MQILLVLVYWGFTEQSKNESDNDVELKRELAEMKDLLRKKEMEVADLKKGRDVNC